MSMTESSEGRRAPNSEAAPAAVPTPDNSPIGKMRKIVETRETGQVGGLSVDFLTARTVIRVYDGLSDQKREKFARLTPKQMVHKAFELDK